jgi:hemolysin activation/secretion protein
MNQTAMNQPFDGRAAPTRARARLSPSLIAGAIAMLCGAAPVMALAQALPAQVDPGALQRQEEERRRYLNEQNQKNQERPVLQQEAPAAAVPAAGVAGPRFMLNEVRFDASALLAEAQLKALAAPYLGREVDFAALSQLVDGVNAAYRAQGVVTARAVLGPQKVAGGVVKITLVEAKLGQVAVQGASYTRQDYIAGAFADQQGSTLDAHALETRLLRFNRAGDLRVEASLHPGSVPGATDLMLQVTEPPRYQSHVFINNEGPRSVGAAQAGIDSTLNGPLGYGDKVSVYLARTSGATSGSLSYAIPVNRFGGHATASYSQGVTEVVAGPYRALGIRGHSKSLQLGLVQPLWHTGVWWFDLAGTLGKTRSDNQIGDLPLSETDIDNQSLGATATAAYAQRSFNFAATATHSREHALNKPERNFTITQLRGSWVESVGAKSFTVLRTVMQGTSAAVLTPSLLFQLGGIGSVRGYDVGALSGDRGYLVNAEFHHAPVENIDAAFFVDAGQVRTKGTPYQSARSVGGSVDLQWRRAWHGNLTVGHALKQILPNQARWRATARLSYEF